MIPRPKFRRYGKTVDSREIDEGKYYVKSPGCEDVYLEDNTGYTLSKIRNILVLYYIGRYKLV